MDRRLLWFVLTGFISGTDSFVLGSLLPSISAELGITVGEAGYLAFTYAIVYAIGTPVLATLFGNADRRKVLLAAEATFAVGAICMVVAPTLPLLIAARVVVGLGVGLFSAMALTTALAISPPERRARTVAIVTSGQSFAVLAGVPLGAFVVTVYSWRVVYLAITVMVLIALAGLFWNLPRGIHGDKVTLRERLSVVKLPGIPQALLLMLLFMSGQYILIIFIAPLAEYAGGLGKEMLPFALFAYGVGAVVGIQLGGRRADRIGSRRATIQAVVAQIILVGVLVAAGSLPPSVGAVVFFVFMPAIAAVGWGFFPAQSSLVSSLVPGSPVLALSLNLTAMNIGVALAARLGGAIFDQAGIFWLAAAPIPVAVAALLVASLMVRTPKGVIPAAPAP